MVSQTTGMVGPVITNSYASQSVSGMATATVTTVSPAVTTVSPPVMTGLPAPAIEGAIAELPTWPVETNIFFPPGVDRVMLTVQPPLIRAIMQDAIENLRASLMFIDAFPDSATAQSFTHQALISAAQNYQAASPICRRLQEDDNYLLRMSRIVSFALQF